MNRVLDFTPLITALTPGSVVTDPDIVAAYRQDAARFPTAGMPAALIRPTSTAEVAATLRWANEQQVPVVPRGAGTGLSGGASAVDGGIVLCLERMRAVTIDRAARVAIAQPGALNVEVKASAARHGLWYPPDPSSFEVSSIGGNAATNAGGLCCVKYGVTGDYVLGMQVVLADGTVLTLGGPRIKDVAGLSLTRLFVGSEGVLGVITELTLRLLAAQPALSTLVASFASTAAAAQAVVSIVERVRPATLELMDAAAINAVEDHLRMGLDRGARALLLARSDAPGPAAHDEIAYMESVCRDGAATEIFVTDDPQEGAALAAARRAALPALERKGDVLLEDVGVPLPALPALMTGIEQISDRLGVLIAVIAHAGDGNTHPIIVYNAREHADAARAEEAFDEIMGLGVALGGTITGEHGVGRLKREWLPAYLGADVFDVSRRIKNALDPNGILNPGAMF